MRVAGGFQVATQALALGLTQVGLLVHQRDEDFALAPALTAKAPHDLLQGLVQGMSGGLQSRGRDRALLADALDEVQEFFWALYSVVASVTR